MAVLKRAQAHQRRGCPEQQQQLLLAVKVELEQLIISILDDPSVSKVMREASFYSPAVKSIIEQSLNPPHMFVNHVKNPSYGSFGPNRNMYLNPMLQKGSAGQSGSQRNEEVKKLIEVLMRSRKRNPVLVGEGEPEAVVKELIRRIEKGGLDEGCLENVQLIQFDKELVSDKNQIPSKIIELGGLIEGKLASGGVLVDLGDLRWLVEHPLGQPPQQLVVSDTGKAVVVEMGKLLARFTGNCNNNNDANNTIWLIGTATCETYLRCQVYHPTMERDWDLQAVPIASRSPPLPLMSSSLGNDRILGKPGQPFSSPNCLSSAKPTLSSNLSDNLNVARKLKLCPQCSEKYEVELGHLEKDAKNSNSDFITISAQLKLPQWLQNAKLEDANAISSLLQGKDKDEPQELQKKWNETCLRLHPSFHHNLGPGRTTLPALSMQALRNPVLSVHQPFQPKLQSIRNLQEIPKLNEIPPTFRPSLNKNLVTLRPSVNENPDKLQPSLNGNPPTLHHSLNDKPATLQTSLNKNAVTLRPSANKRIGGSPRSPVRTDLVLGRKSTELSPETASEGNFKDFLECQQMSKPLDKFSNALDAETFKKLIKGLMEKAWWQADAASGVAQAVTRCRLGNGKQRGGSRGDIWLLFTGPDRVGKKKMASVLSEQICGTTPVMISLGLRPDYEEQDLNLRGKTPLDRLAEAVRRNPFSVIMIEDIDEADFPIRGSIKRAIDRGRLTDSHGREIRLGNVVFIVTGNWSTVNYEDHANWLSNKKLEKNGNWLLRLTVSEKGIKRRANRLLEQDRPRKTRELNSSLSLDLNLAGETEDARADESHDLTHLTNDHEEEVGFDDQQFSITAVPRELLDVVDDSIVFRPVDFHFIRKETRKTIANKFSIVVDDKFSMEVEDAALEKMIGGVLHGKESLEEWVEKALVPSFEQVESILESAHLNVGVRLDLDPDTDFAGYSNGDQLPSKLRIVVHGIPN